MFTVAFWKIVAERAVKSAAAAVIAVWSATSPDWAGYGEAALIGAGFSVLASVVSAQPWAPGPTGDPSLVKPPTAEG